MDILVRSEQLLPMKYMSNLPRRAKQQSFLNSKLQEVLTELDSASHMVPMEGGVKSGSSQSETT